MKLLYTALFGVMLMAAPVAVAQQNAGTVSSADISPDGAVDYAGYLNIEMNGMNIATDQASAIIITPGGEGKCDFLLPNLTLNMGGSEMALGDIAVNDVNVISAAGTDTYTGEVKGLKLMGGAIEADVNLNGTIAGGKVNMKIDVMWSGIPINVTFTTDKTAGIGDIEAPEEAAPEYFNLQGVRMDATSLTPGIYVRKQGRESVKVTVK